MSLDLQVTRVRLVPREQYWPTPQIHFLGGAWSIPTVISLPATPASKPSD